MAYYKLRCNTCSQDAPVLATSPGELRRIDWGEVEEQPGQLRLAENLESFIDKHCEHETEVVEA